MRGMPKYQIRCIVAGLALYTSADTLLGQSQTDPAESSVYRAATLVLHSSDSASVWEGFSGPTEFIVCTEDGGTLYALREPPSQPSSLVMLGGSNVAQLYYSPERPARLETRCFYLDFSFDGRLILSFPEIDSIYSVSDPVRALAAISALSPAESPNRWASRTESLYVSSPALLSGNKRASRAIA